ncbi:ATP-dependent Clp protease proteolytic subunit [Agrobacterium salinitolerans]|uniref:ATP-dependent Clp protease proteolytic subunit n=1 Tax=Agrobacterium salinitolerans TaxID=1183413 RepID=UPI00157392E8
MILLDFSPDKPSGPSGSGPALHIDIRGDIDAELLARVASVLDAYPDAAELHLHVDSPGGDFVPAFDMYVALSNHRAAHKVANIANASSAALLPVIAMDHRVAAPSARILLHQVEQCPRGRWTAAKHAETADFLSWLDASMAAGFAIRTGAPAEVFLAAMADEEPASLDWCLSTNILTEIRNV